MRTILTGAEGYDLVVELRIDLEAASLASPEVAKPGRHPVTGVDELLRFQPQLLERLVQPLPEADDLGRPSAGVRPLACGEHPLDLGIKRLDGGVEVTPVVGRNEISGFLDILLRHHHAQYRATPPMGTPASRGGGAYAFCPCLTK